ncbi:DUF4391 domain-containing protein [Agarivorans sp. QJM3NY_29]|uniref:DUF4391 domain-containing protein n=1 Tax=unclassified Agarivorans TaxID=2636026 RepID=UPI003D7C9F5A
MELINFRNNDKTEHSSLIEKVCENLALPDSTFLGTRITKKMLVDNNELSSNDKKLVTDVIQSIEWQNTLKPETLNVPIYVTDTVEYIEIAVIRVVLKSEIKNKTKLKNVAKLLHTLIPYPVILLLELGEELAISLADKRINQADKSKLVIEHIYNSDWLSSTSLTENENNFLNDFSLKNVSSLNYFELYQDFISMLIALDVSCLSGVYRTKSIQGDLTELKFVAKSNEDKTILLHKLATLEADLTGIRNRLKKETQMNQKLKLNVEAKKIKLSINKIRSCLS